MVVITNELVTGKQFAISNDNMRLRAKVKVFKKLDYSALALELHFSSDRIADNDFHRVNELRA